VRRHRHATPTRRKGDSQRRDPCKALLANVLVSEACVSIVSFQVGEAGVEGPDELQLGGLEHADQAPSRCGQLVIRNDL
jgi:hypothetical protein